MGHYITTGKLDMKDPATQQLVHGEMKNMLASPEARVQLGEQIGGPVGKMIMQYFNLPQGVQMALAASLFAVLGGLMGGGGGAMAGAALGGVGAAVLSNLPQISEYMNGQSQTPAASYGVSAPGAQPPAPTPPPAGNGQMAI
jgi:hypothetical protein